MKIPRNILRFHLCIKSLHIKRKLCVGVCAKVYVIHKLLSSTRDEERAQRKGE